MVDSARALAAAREKSWRDGLVSVQTFGSGKYDTRTAQEEKDVLAVVNVKNGRVKRLMQAGRLINAPEIFAGKVAVTGSFFETYDTPAGERAHIKTVVSTIDPFSGEKKLIDPAAPSAPKPLAWSRSGRYLLFERAMETEDERGSERAYAILDVDSGKTVDSLPAGASDFAWVGDRLVYFLNDERASANKHDDERRIAVAVASSPPVATSGDAYYYLDEGDLWRGGLDGAPENLTRDYPHRINLYEREHRASLAPIRPSHASATPPSLEEAYFVTELDGRRSLVMFSNNGDTFSTLPFPLGDYVYLLAATVNGAVFLTNTYGVGSQLHYVAAGEPQRPRLLYHFNRQLADAQPAAGPVRIDHKDYEGDDVAGWLFLPPDASPDTPEPLPLVVIAYPGLIYDEPPLNRLPYAQSFWDLRLTVNTIMEVYAGQGYAVLLPSIPYAKDGGPGEPMMQMMPAILSALDGAIKTGFVDSDRMALSGQSFGGYAALSVATQTDRFQAIIAMAPLSNLTSIYGQFLPGVFPYGDGNGKLFATRAQITESGQTRMKAPPWREPERYIRNSPFFYVDKVKTPLLILHSDLDTAALMTQSEEMFTGLYRENKDVLYVRYLGANHVIIQPQHQRDMWERTFQFLRDHGVAPE